MAYIFKQKFNIGELARLPKAVNKVLIAEPEEYLLALYCYHLSGSDFFVRPCREVDAVYSQVVDFVPQLLIINQDFLLAGGAPEGFMRRLRKSNPSMRIVTLGNKTSASDLKGLMAAGPNAHIDRSLTKPQDIIAVARTLLK